MTLSIYFPRREVTFPVIGKINCKVNFLEQKISELFGDPKFPIVVARIGLIYTRVFSGFCSYLTEPMIALPLTFADLVKAVYVSQDETASTALALAKIALSSVLFVYAIQATRDGSLKEFSEYLWESSKTAKRFLDQAEKGSYTDAEFSEPLQIPVKSTWSKIISIPATIINVILERLHMVWIQLKSFLSDKVSSTKS